jgi:predicted ester cyclase
LYINGKAISSPEAFRDQTKAGRVHLDVDAITVDEQTRRLGVSILVKFTTANSAVNRTIKFIEQHLIWVENDKISKMATMMDRDSLQRQLSDPIYSPTPDLIGDRHGDVAEKKLSTRELEETYRAYVGCINAQTMKSGLPTFCHPQVIHNTKQLSLEEYLALIQDAFTAVPDIVFGIDTVVADELAQRIAVRLEFTGTPTGTLAGVEPTGRSGEFYLY